MGQTTPHYKLDKLPPEGMAMFTPDPDQSDEPACQLNRLGGIGRFGQYGTRRGALKPMKWTRVVIVVTLGRDLGLTTYVCTPRGALKCASVKQSAFNRKDGWSFLLLLEFLAIEVLGLLGVLHGGAGAEGRYCARAIGCHCLWGPR